MKGHTVRKCYSWGRTEVSNDTKSVLSSGVLRLRFAHAAVTLGEAGRGGAFTQKPVSLALEPVSCHVGRVAEGCLA